MKLATQAYLDTLQKKADAMKDVVLHTESDWRTPGITPTHIYYFSADGDDTNDGLSEASPKQSLAALANLPLAYGDVILFRRGDLFRGHIRPVPGLTFSAYGEGDKPTISGSMKNYADPALWEATGHENVWRLTEKLRNVGIITFDHFGVVGDYHRPVGIKKIPEVNGFADEADLAGEYEFFSNLDTDELFLWCEENPGEKWSSIEIGDGQHVFWFREKDFLTIDNLHITMTGAHGIGAGNVTSLTVKNCVFDWIGGSILIGYRGANRTRYGNAVEIAGGVDGYYVYNNWIYQIYDTGITHQYSYHPEVPFIMHNDVNYHDNLIEYCYWSIEYYNATKGDIERVTSNVHVHDNFCRFGGEGWGCPGRAAVAPMCHLGITKEKLFNYVNENNIFEKCTGFLITWSECRAVFRNNTYVQPLGWKLARIGGESKLFDETAPETLKIVGETNPTLVYLKPETAPES